MALVKCNECGKEISDKAIVCPSCGYKKSVKPMTKLDKIFVPIIVITIIMGISGLCMAPQLVKRTNPNAKMENNGQDAFIVVDGKMTPNPNYKTTIDWGDVETDYSQSIFISILSISAPTIATILFIKLKKKERENV